ncbi:restriction endonuclease subunit S [Listeria monocytogenes]|jgi:type I restriction enzyme S subunit|uniref:restriction endonuclease subunit S n=1 Tax=Listeria monocytogenes TaxID=1639 RepID=UPI001F5A663D|nr:restriction endonuclease subunit S [Listeria monocytogenes]MCI2642822.1 restriction endonuclease subunit S [Listeria monocytogenes]MCP8211922.1 restriction endonuclease subunit S [Listeria monocytogenes]
MSRVRFGDIVTDVKKKVDRNNNPYEFYVAGDHMDTEDLEIHRKGKFATDDVGPAFIREFKVGQVLYGSRRTYLKKVAVADFDGVTANTTFVLETSDDKKFLQELLPFVMLSEGFTQWSIMKSKGSTNPYVLFSDLADYEFELPDIEKQRELAKVLWAMDATKRSYQHLLQKTDELVKAQFVEMFGKPGSDTKGWGLTTLGNCCELNPRRPKDMNDEVEYSFVAMPSVSEKGIIDTSILRPYSEVCKGFTYFAENDVLFAKITPCMENGKGGVAVGLKNGAGFGSTEFHVLRPIIGKSNPYWLYIITMFSKFRGDAEKVMTGTGGQRRVPITYLDQYPISLPPIKLQEQFEGFVRQSNKSKLQLEQALEELIATSKKIISENLS